MMFTPFAHQQEFSDFWAEREKVLNLSGCGTGKTLACIHTVREHWPDARVLVIAPLSILRTAWGNDLNFGWYDVTWDIAYSRNREKVMTSDKQWVITNHDAVKAIMKNDWHKEFDVLIVDEADAFRNRTTQRSKALCYITDHFDKISLMTGTPTPKTVLDIWHLAFQVDRGERLGRNFFEFRSQVCTPQPIPGVVGAMRWDDKVGANDMVMSMLHDITHRVTLDEVAELPDISVREISIELPRKLRRAYDELKRESLLELESGAVLNSIHAGARVSKLLQLVSGAIYDGTGEYHDVHTERTELVMELVEETDAALVAFNWTHQRDALVKSAAKRGLEYAVIDGSTPVGEREQIVMDFQAGKLRVLFAHPQSAGHGITLTRANRVIWASPNYRADLYEQFNHRIYRHGQSRKTEIIHIAASDTAEVDVYTKLTDKKMRMDDLLHLAVGLKHQGAA
ncbi:SNF2-related protein [Vibrio astriarenae]